jgi:NADPH:quinone reductase
MQRIEITEFGDSGVLRLAEVDPPEPGQGQVRVRVRAAGVNPADTYIRTGTYAFFKPDLPWTPGFDAAGDVDKLGADVEGLRVGQRVFTAALLARQTGAYAEYMVCDAEAIHPLSGHLSYEQGAAVGVPCVTAYRALVQRGGISKNETILVHGGSGGVGLPTVQLARSLGAKVIASASTPAGRALVAGHGAHHVVDHSQSGYLDEILALTEGRGVDLIVEMLANVNLESDLSVLARYGRVVVVGSRGTLEFTPRLTMMKEADIRGMALWNMSAADWTEATVHVMSDLSRGSITPNIGRSFPLAQANVAHDFVIAGGACGKVVLTC